MFDDALEVLWSKAEHTLWLLSSKKERKEDFFTQVMEDKNFRTNALVQEAVGLTPWARCAYNQRTSSCRYGGLALGCSEILLARERERDSHVTNIHIHGKKEGISPNVTRPGARNQALLDTGQKVSGTSWKRAFLPQERHSVIRASLSLQRGQLSQ